MITAAEHSKEKKLYDQIRFIDLQGKEQIRVDFDLLESRGCVTLETCNGELGILLAQQKHPDLINKADEALYRAKKEDRDPVSLICKKDYREN